MCSRPAKASKGTVCLAFGTLAVFGLFSLLACILNSPLHLASTSDARKMEQSRYSHRHSPDRPSLSGSSVRKEENGAQGVQAQYASADDKRQRGQKQGGRSQRHRKARRSRTDFEEQHCLALSQEECRADPLCSLRSRDSTNAQCKACRHPPCRQPNKADGRQARSGVTSDAKGRQRLLGEAQRVYPAKVGGRWSSGRPYLDEAAKAGEDPLSAGIQLLLGKLDVSALQEELLQQGPEMWNPDFQARENAYIDGRAGNVGRFKPGVQDQLLVFSDQEGASAVQMPWMERYKPWLDPLLDELVGAEHKSGIVRMQFAKMSGSASIKKHADLGRYATHGHRIHVPISLGPSANFSSCPAVSEQSGAPECVSLQLEEGLAFELNNVIPHKVTHEGNVPRIHLVVDVMRDPVSVERTVLQKGQRCRYTGKIPKMFIKC